MKKIILLSIILGLVIALGVGLTVSIINSTNDDIYSDIDDIYDETWRDYLTLEERIELLESEMEWQEDYIDSLEGELIDALTLIALFQNYNDDLRYIREAYYPDAWYDAQQDELYNLYAEKLVEEFPNYYSSIEDVSVETETLTVALDDWTINISYQALEFTLFIEEVEVCNEVCEILPYTQTDFVMTVEELEQAMLDILETLNNLPT